MTLLERGEAGGGKAGETLGAERSRGHATNSAPLIWINPVSGHLVSFPVAIRTLELLNGGPK